MFLHIHLNVSFGFSNIEGRRRKGRQRMRWLHGIPEAMGMSLSKFQEIVKDMEAWRAAVHRVAESDTEQLNSNMLESHGM